MQRSRLLVELSYFFVFFVLLALASACGGPLSEGRSEFDKGHYAAARQALASMDRPGRWGVPERAQYALYRGLTCGALGDLARARAWLHEARALEDAYPGSLPADDEQRLRAAMQSYEVAP
jgi:hypothetical protein